MKILIGSLTYPLANGVTTSIDASTDGLTSRGHEVRIIGPQYGVGRASLEHQPVSASSLSSWLLSAVHKKERMFAIQATSEIRAVARDWQPDIFWLHSVTWQPNAFERVMLRN